MQKTGTLGVQKSRCSTNTLVRISLLSAISFLLMFIEMPIPGLFPEFLKIDISDIPALIAGLSMGPIAGVAVEIVKNVLHILITGTTTGGVGELANIIVGSSFVVGSALVYGKSKTRKGLIVSLVVGSISMVIVGSLMNYFVLLPFYAKIMSMDAIIAMGKAVNPRVNDLMSFVLWFIAPFNLIKGVMISLLILPVYKKLESFIKTK